MPWEHPPTENLTIKRMKILIKNSVNFSLCLLWIGTLPFFAFGSRNEPYWPWGPLTQKDALPKIEFKPVKWIEIKKDPKTDMLTRGKALATDQKTELILTRNEEGFIAQVLSKGKTIMEPRLCTSFAPFFENMYHCGFINDDDKIDFLLHFYCGGNGLNADFNEVTLLLSNDKGYKATSIHTFRGGPENHYVKIEDKSHFIMKSFGGVAECLDGKNHNFWTYNLLEIKGDTLYLANQNHRIFPRTIWYTFEPNSKETDMLSKKDKEDLLIRSIQDLKLIGNTVSHCPEPIQNN